MRSWWWFSAGTWCWSSRSLSCCPPLTGVLTTATTLSLWGPLVALLPPTTRSGDSGTLSHLHSTGVSSRDEVIISGQSFWTPFLLHHPQTSWEGQGSCPGLPGFYGSVSHNLLLPKCGGQGCWATFQRLRECLHLSFSSFPVLKGHLFLSGWECLLHHIFSLPCPMTSLSPVPSLLLGDKPYSLDPNDRGVQA